jgi:hypothetical protein
LRKSLASAASTVAADGQQRSVNWSWELREGKDGPKWTKQPKQSNLRDARSNDPQSWSDCEPSR